MAAFATSLPLPLHNVTQAAATSQPENRARRVRRPAHFMAVVDDEEITNDKERKPRFDPDSEMDAFGHDPKKATEFWRTSARDLLDSKEVKDAIEQHATNPTELDPERAAYLQFIKQLDEKKEEK